MSNEIIDIIDKLGEQFGIAIDWTSENVMPYVETIFQKAVNYSAASTIVWLCVSALILALGVIMIVVGIKNQDEDDEFAMAMCYFGSIALLIGIGITVGNILHLIKCYTLPELVFLDAIKGVLS